MNILPSGCPTIHEGLLSEDGRRRGLTLNDVQVGLPGRVQPQEGQDYPVTVTKVKRRHTRLHGYGKTKYSGQDFTQAVRWGLFSDVQEAIQSWIGDEQHLFDTWVVDWIEVGREDAMAVFAPAGPDHFRITVPVCFYDYRPLEIFTCRTNCLFMNKGYHPVQNVPGWRRLILGEWPTPRDQWPA